MRKRHKYPLIIIVLLVVLGTLFTFSLLTVTLSKPVTMQLSMPDKTNAHTPASKLTDTIKIIVIGNSEVYFESNANGEKGIVAINSADLKSFLEKQCKIIGKDKFTIILTANENGRYEDMVEVLDIFSILEFKRYALLEISEQDLATLKEYQLSHKN